MDIVLKEFIKCGGDGIEVDYPYKNLEDTQNLKDNFKNIAKENNLIIGKF